MSEVGPPLVPSAGWAPRSGESAGSETAMGTRTGWRRAGWAGLGTAALVASSVLVGPGPVGAVAVGVTVLTDLPVKVLAPVGISDAGTSTVTARPAVRVRITGPADRRPRRSR